jgi:hypothetical protein
MGIYEQEQAYLDAERYCEVSDLMVEAAKPVSPETLLRERVEILAKELPGTTFGYIGNFERWGDDRSFHIFLPHPGRVGSYEDSVSLGSVKQLPTALDKWPSLEASARAKYAKGVRQ